MDGRLYPKDRVRRNPVFFVPKNFSPDILPADLRAYSDCAYYLLDLIRIRTEFGNTDQHGWVLAKVDYLREVVPKHVERPLRIALIDAGVIEHDHRFTPGKQAMSHSGR